MAFKFYEAYFNFIGISEAPKIYHRWCAVSMIGALLARKVSFPFGHGLIYPNQYILLTGSPGTRKGTAMGPAKNLLKALGYKKTAPQRLSPEKFLSEMQKLNNPSSEDIDGYEIEKLEIDAPSEIYVVSDEFGDFIKGNTDFIRLLTNLWDNLDEYRHPKLHGSSVYVLAPTINILGATTPQDMAITMPIEAIGQGSLSRYILVHADPTGIQIPFPEPPAADATQAVLEQLEKISQLSGIIVFSDEARELCAAIYKNAVKMEDPRFLYFNTRRYTHMLKLAIIFAAMDCTVEVSITHVLQANTLLHVTEHRMPKALGEFGKARHADVANIIMERLRTATRPLTIRELYKYVSQDLNKMDDLIELVKSLQQAEKIQSIKGPKGQGYLPLHAAVSGWDPKYLITNEFLQPEERV